MNGRQQRAQDRESSLSSSSSSASSTSTTYSRTDLSDLNSNELGDLQFRTEMEYYDEVVVRAEGVIEQERERQRLEESADNNEIQSDSELSMLASSLFNGIEGIESSQGINVEMGGTSGCQRDSEHGGHGDGEHGDSEHGDGGHSDSSIQSTVFSPRRIRSGKILNCMSP